MLSSSKSRISRKDRVLEIVNLFFFDSKFKLIHSQLEKIFGVIFDASFDPCLIDRRYHDFKDVFMCVINGFVVSLPQVMGFPFCFDYDVNFFSKYIGDGDRIDSVFRTYYMREMKYYAVSKLEVSVYDKECYSQVYEQMMSDDHEYGEKIFSCCFMGYNYVLVMVFLMVHYQA